MDYCVPVTVAGINPGLRGCSPFVEVVQGEFGIEDHPRDLHESTLLVGLAQVEPKGMLDRFLVLLEHENELLQLLPTPFKWTR